MVMSSADVLEDGAPFHYGPPASGLIAGHPVRCVAAGTQLRAHLGYPPTPKDHRDVRLLAERFRLEPPPPYA